MRDIKRSSGILMHISSLPGPYGIGDFGRGAYEFVDFLVKAGQKFWQILPLGPTGFGDSPYQCFSAFAGNPYFIDLDEFIQRAYLLKEDIDGYKLGQEPDRIDYGLVYENKMKLLRRAYDKAKDSMTGELADFYEENMSWLRDFALFMAVKASFQGASWLGWEDQYREYNSRELLDYERENQDEIFFWVFTQYYFTGQWEKLKKYANERGIQIIGDLPIYVSEDSSDTWSKPDLFNIDSDLLPRAVSGYPPDNFSDGGQLWGNPIYDWNSMEDQGYQWWLERIRYSFQLFDYLRIDHFMGFENYWQVAYGSKDARDGQWVKGPGKKLFKKIKEGLGDLNIIAEDLGLITEDVKDLLEFTGFPGMKVLQFAFDPWGESEYLPHSYEKNSVVYTGTHDNPTIMDWLESASEGELNYAIEYLRLGREEGYNWGFIRGAWSSPANLAIAPMQDFLGLGGEARMNTPSSLANNWLWRLDRASLTDELAKRIGHLTRIYRR
ncbi:MAG: 4-alpha-glucanotransferase [Tissierellaceae bacterium]